MKKARPYLVQLALIVALGLPAVLLCSRAALGDGGQGPIGPKSWPTPPPPPTSARVIVAHGKNGNGLLDVISVVIEEALASLRL